MRASCSTCHMEASEVGFLCQVGEHAYNPALKTLECRRCTAEGVMERESLRAIQEDADMDNEHFAHCGFCSNRRGVLPKLALLQACSENRRAQEARKVA